MLTCATSSFLMHNFPFTTLAEIVLKHCHSCVINGVSNEGTTSKVQHPGFCHLLRVQRHTALRQLIRSQLTVCCEMSHLFVFVTVQRMSYHQQLKIRHVSAVFEEHAVELFIPRNFFLCTLRFWRRMQMCNTGFRISCIFP